MTKKQSAQKGWPDDPMVISEFERLSSTQNMIKGDGFLKCCRKYYKVSIEYKVIKIGVRSRELCLALEVDHRGDHTEWSGTGGGWSGTSMG